MFLDDAVSEPEAQTGTSVALGGIKGLEDASQVALLDAAAVVGDGDAGSAAVRASSEAVGPLVAAGYVQGQPATVVESIEGVEDEVGEELADSPAKPHISTAES